MADPSRRSSRNGSPIGRGLFYALELVADRPTKAPFDPSLAPHALAPPFIIENAHFEMIVDRLRAALDAALASLDESR